MHQIEIIENVIKQLEIPQNTFTMCVHPSLIIIIKTQCKYLNNQQLKILIETPCNFNNVFLQESNADGTTLNLSFKRTL